MMAAEGGGADLGSLRAGAAFNDSINRRDLDALRELMTDGHTFIDSEDNVLSGKDEVLDAWRGFFDAFPAYRNDWATLMQIGSTLIAVGRSVCSTEPGLEGPAIWTATITDDKVSEWRVYEDTPANRRRLGTGQPSD
jgi:ketosteroid isomerase-like protein